MAKYKSLVITNSGLNMIAAAENGDTIKYLRLEIGSGTYSGNEDIASMTALKKKEQEFSFSGITRTDSTIKLVSTIQNDNVITGYNITELGVFAKNAAGKETLFAMIIAEKGMEDYIVPYESSPYCITVKIYIEVSNAETISFVCDLNQDVFASMQDLEDYRTEVNEKMSTMETETKSSIESLSKNIGDISALPESSTNIVGAVNQLFQSASNGKTQVATAITGMGVSTAATSTYETMAANIKKIKTGTDTTGCTATAGDILSGKTAGSKGSVITGTIASWNPDYSDQADMKELTYGAFSNNDTPYLYLGVYDKKYINGINWVRAAAEEVAKAIGLNTFYMSK